jgi:pseudaminic acid synthase
MSEISIAGRKIGTGYKPYVIAEISANHSQKYPVAEALIRGSAEAGVDAIKLQTYTAETMTLDVDLPEYRIKEGLWKSEKLFDLYRRAETPWDWTENIQILCSELGIALFSSPFDSTAVDFLETFDVPAHKVASFELTDLPLLKKIASTGKPVIASTGMATKDEIETAIRVLSENGSGSLALLRCTSAYPAPFNALNLSLIPKMMQDFNVPIGFSDHSLGTASATAAVALGACIVEKHVKTVGSESSPDAAFSASLEDMKELVFDVNVAFEARGNGEYGPSDCERPMIALRRSVIASKDIYPGQVLGPENITVRRPNIGLPPSAYEKLIGMTAHRTIQRGEGITSNNVSIPLPASGESL